MARIVDPVLAAAVRRDPVPPRSRRASHLHVVAYPHQPVRLPAAAVDAAVAGTGCRVLDEVFPGWRQLVRREDRGVGTVGFCSAGLAGRRLQPDAEERELIDVEVTTGGQVTLFSGRGSDHHTPTRNDVILDGGIVTLTRSVVTLAGLLGATAGYAGPWCAGLALTDLAGQPGFAALHGRACWRPPMTAAAYTRTIETSTAELHGHPEQVTRRLVDPLLDALGTNQEARLRPHR